MADTPETTQKALKILVVEDSPTQLEELRFLLEESGFSVVAATNGQEGLEAARAKEVDLVISDIVMPEMDGYALCRALRADQTLRHLPVILLTALADPRDVIRGLESGASNFICKPYNDRALLTRVHNVIANQEIRKGASSEMGISIFFAGQRFFITADRLQILDLLLSTYENAVNRNSELLRARDELRVLNEQLEERVAVRTASLTAEIEERKQAQQALETSEARFRAVVASAPAAIVVAQAGKIVLWNAGAEQLFQYSPQEAMGQPVTMLIPEPYLARHREAVQRFHASGETRLPGKAYEAQALRKDGSQCPVQVSLAVWQSAQGGFASAFITDITERRRAEEALRAAEERYRQIVESLNVIVWRADAWPVRFTFVSPEAKAILGYPAERWTEEASFWQDHIHPEDRDFTLSFCRKAVEEPRNYQFEYRMLAADGRTVWLQDVVRVVVENGHAKELVGVMIDVGERKRLEEQLRQAQKMEAVGQLAGGVAHDFNNLLGVIMGYSELVLRDLGPQHPAHRRVEQIRQASERAATLTRQLLAFSRKQVVQPKVLNLNVVVADIEEMLRRLIGEDIHLATVFTEDLGRVTADQGQIEQVIVNLAVNARDAMPGGGRLAIETGNADLDEAYTRSHAEVSAGPHVMLAVTDTGCGMDAATAARVFEPFFTTKEPGKGTGLGLATVYGIVKQSGGHVNVYSESGLGSTFKVYLPRVEAEVLPARVAGAPAAAPSGFETILLVEDDANLREVIREVLESAGYTVLEAGDPERALETVAALVEPLHLMITDVVMPRMSGPELATRIGSVRAETRVLYMSGYTDRAGSIALAAGDHFIQKPFALDALLRRVREILGAAE